MNRQLLALAAVSLLTLAAPSDLRCQDTAYWTQADLAAYAKSLAPKINEQHFALERLGEFGSHFALMVHREGNGPAEIHDDFTDFYVVQAGAGTLYTGGEVVEPKTTDPGEIRGKSIKGGQTRPLKPGDVVNIPPKTPHQVTIESGKTITYLIVKIRAKP